MAWVFLLAAVALALMLLHKLLGTRTASPAGGRKATAASGWRRRTVVASAAGAVPRASYVPWEAAKDSAEDVLVVDCTHSSAKTITHHKGDHNPPLRLRSDCSTGLVLDVLAAAAGGGRDGAAVAPWLRLPLTSVNHFDADAVLSMWCFINREAAPQHSAVLRHAARIGDLREMGLGSSPEAAAARGWDGVDSEEQVHHALKLAVWINSIERTRFSPPYMDKDAAEKHAWFLERLAHALTPEGIEQLRPEWEEEYERVLDEWAALERGRPATVQRHAGLGAAIVRSPRALHYYSLFSFAIGCDTVVTVMPGQKYEVESRYTQFIQLWSRPVQPRLDMGPLARALNRVDRRREPGTEWGASSMVDTGPILRLDECGSRLPKAQRYGHPADRPLFRSGLPPAAFEAAVCSFLRHGLAGTAPRAGGWSWEETQELNAGIDWAAWERGVLPSVLAAAGFSVEDGSAAAGAALKDSDVVAPSPQAGADPPVHPSLIRE